MGGAFPFLLALFKALPVLQEWFHEFHDYLQEWEKGQAEKKRLAAIDKAISPDHPDQRDLESDEIRGKPSHKEGMQIRPKRDQ
jgi:hypothetical protein